MSFSEDLEKTCEYIAVRTFEQLNEPYTERTIAAETSRLERCLEWHYTYTKHNQSFEGFCLKFLTDNVQKIINRTDYQETYLNDVVDKNIYAVTRAVSKKSEVSYPVTLAEEEDNIDYGFLIKIKTGEIQ